MFKGEENQTTSAIPHYYSCIMLYFSNIKAINPARYSTPDLECRPICRFPVLSAVSVFLLCSAPTGNVNTAVDELLSFFLLSVFQSYDIFPQR